MHAGLNMVAVWKRRRLLACSINQFISKLGAI